MYNYNNTTTIVLWPSVQDYPGEVAPEETFTHSHYPDQQPSLISFLHIILHVQFMRLTVFCIPLSGSSFVYLLLEPYTSYVIHFLARSSSFATHAHTITPCFAVVLTTEIMCQLFTWNAIFHLNITYHVTILISAC